MTNQTSPTGERIPATIGRYQIIDALGYGAMGAVYKAFDPLIKRTLAIKTIRLDVPKTSPQHALFIERFYQEARISGALSHPCIVTLFDIGEEGGVPFLAMEFIDGRTVASYIEEGTRFRPEKVVGLVSQVASALDYAHSQGVVHRDIKPSNLMLYDADKVKVADFGIAKLADADITHAGALVGTPSYMSPEQAMGERLDGRSDIFSLGVCAFEMLSGQQPFPGANVTAILYKLVHVDPVEPLDLEANGLVPEKWREVFARVLAKKPADRYQKAGEFVRDLEYCLGAWFTGLGEETAVLGALDRAPAGEPATVLLSAPGPAAEGPEVEATALMPAMADETVAARPADEPQTVLLAPAAAPAEEPATVLISSPPMAAPPAPPAEDATVLMPQLPPQDEVPATVLMPAPPPPPVGVSFEPTPRPPEASRTLPPQPTTRHRTDAGRAGSRTPRRGVPVALVLGAVGLVALASLALLGYALWRRVQPQATVASPASVAPTTLAAAPATPPPTTLAAAPISGSLHVESDPPGAAVRVNGAVRGTTPLDLTDLAAGEYLLELERPGYEVQSQRIPVTAERPSAELRFKLTRAAPQMGAADIFSSPPGASVTIDGRPAGRTPVNGVALRAGSRTVRMDMSGYEPWSGSIDVVAHQKGRLEARLKPLPAARPAAPPPPAPQAVDLARVYPDGEVDVKPRRLSGTTPSYPSGAPHLKSGERVSVLVQFVVTDTGAVRDVKVVESGGRAVDEAVVAAVRGWKFEPAVKQGTKVKSLTMFRQTFLGG
ncbi:MAG TPA: TonB family protein [Vicinamibacteria bacterium]|nr:TonB family protein [Vicinamibacteria bacterium]